MKRTYTINLGVKHIMKTLPALLFALGITAILAIGMAVIGVNALVNPATLPITNSPASSGVAAASFSPSSSSSTSASASSADQAQIAQLQALVTQYQDREKQYQSELTDAANQLSQANAQLAQFQQLLTVLEQRGIIRVNSAGQIFLGRGQ